MHIMLHAKRQAAQFKIGRGNTGAGVPPSFPCALSMQCRQSAQPWRASLRK